MKRILVLMVLLNVGFAVWQVNYAASSKPTVTVAEVALPGHVNRLLLLDELEEERLRERTESIAKANLDEPDASVEQVNGDAGIEDSTQQCFSVGPLENQEDIDRVGLWLADLGAQPALRESERREVSRFWVYLPPFTSRAKAMEQVEQMVTDSIQDIYVIPRGDMANAISLGLYSHQSSLDRRLAELSTKGYQPVVAPRYESKKAAWFDVEFEDGFEYPMEDFAHAFPDFETSQSRCT